MGSLDARPPPCSHRRAPTPVLALLERWGADATSFQMLQPGLSYHRGVRGSCVAYVDTGQAWVTAGSPLAPEGELSEAAADFEAAASGRGRRVAYAGVEARFVEAVRCGWLAIGHQPLLSPAAWARTLASAPSLREQLRRARAKGVRVGPLGADDLAQPGGGQRARVEALVQRWLRSRALPPLGFLVGGTPLSLPSERCSFGAERDGQLVGFASLAPIYARDGWLLEHLVRAPDAPNGTSELLVDAALRAALTRQSRFVSLGLAPLAGDVTPWLGWLGRLGQGLYDFAGLARFKAKFRPGCWEPVYLAFPQRGSAARALCDSLTAVAGQPLLRFGCGALASALQAR